MYPLGEMCRENSSLLVDLVVQVVDLDQDTQEKLNLWYDILWLLLFLFG